jgi:hypothetical protein
MVAAWECRNCRQVVSVRRWGAGGIRNALRTQRIVDALTPVTEFQQFALDPLVLCVPKTSSTSCDQAVFVDQATGTRLFPDAVLLEIDRFGVAVSAGQRRLATGEAGAGYGGSRTDAGSTADEPGSR